MKRLRFLYRMELVFTEPVTEHYFVLRFVPQSTDVQRIGPTHCLVEPSCLLEPYEDGFGNRAFAGNIRGAHERFAYEVSGTAAVDQSLRRPETASAIYRFESPLTRPDDALICLYRQLCPSGASGLQRAVSLMHGLYVNFRYVPGSTTIRTTASEAWAKGGGVCQDYAHILTALCRLDGLPARYVAGLMLGEGKSHAWTEVYTDGRWTGLDPTNDCMVSDGYIAIAHGRDYRDCAVDRGVLKGNAGQAQNVYVKVEEI